MTGDLKIAEVQERLREFIHERGWEPFQTPKNLAMALSVETAELVELFQWLTPEASMQTGDHLPAQRVGEEMADILIYMMTMARILGIDLADAVDRKIEANGRKYPV